MLLGKSSVFLALMGIVRKSHILLPSSSYLTIQFLCFIVYQLYQKTTEPLQISIGKTREEKDKDSFLNQLDQDAKNEK